jgi:hypothetical protein
MGILVQYRNVCDDDFVGVIRGGCLLVARHCHCGHFKLIACYDVRDARNVELGEIQLFQIHHEDARVVVETGGVCDLVLLFRFGVVVLD